MMARITSIVILILILQSDALTQPRQRGYWGGQDRVETIRQVKMIEALGVEKETAARLTVLYSDNREAVLEIHREIDVLIDELERAIDSDKPDSELEQIRFQIDEKRNTLHQTRMEFYDDVGDYLSERQLAKLIIFERNFNRDMQRIIRDMQRDRRRGR